MDAAKNSAHAASPQETIAILPFSDLKMNLFIPFVKQLLGLIGEIRRRTGWDGMFLW